MTNTYYSLDGIKTKLKKDISREKSLLAAWEKVTFLTKKDGSPFSNFSKNIAGGKYHGKEYSMQAGEMELTVYAYDSINGYIHDSIACYELVKYMKDENKLSKTANYIPKQSYLEQVYKYDLEDIKEAVKNRIEYFKNRIESLNKQLEIVDNCYNDFKQKYSEAIETLKNNCSVAGSVGFSGGTNDIYYMILDTIKDRFPYC